VNDEFIAIDFETATESPDSAVSVGLVKYRNFKPMASYYSLIKPPRLYIRPDFTELHGLTVGDVKNAPDFKYVWENELHGFFKTPASPIASPVSPPLPATPLFAAPLFAGHNAQFDMSVLCSVLRHYEIEIPETQYFCTLQLSRRVWPRLRSFALAKLAAEFNIVYEAHNAVADADTCAKIVVLAAEEVSSKLKRKKIIGLDGLLKKTGIEVKKLPR